MTSLAGRLTRLERVHRGTPLATVDKLPFDWPAFAELWRECFGDDDPADESDGRGDEGRPATSP